MQQVVQNVFTLPFIGVAVKTPHGTATAKGILLMNSVDLPARAAILNMKQFNGKFACCYCDQEGQTSATSTLVRYWPPVPSRALRTHTDMLQAARESHATKTVVCRRRSSLQVLPNKLFGACLLTYLVC